MQRNPKLQTVATVSLIASTGKIVARILRRIEMKIEDVHG
jgi:hypothetical protein